MLLALLAGLPWALVHGVGWPLPERIPTLDEVEAVLMAPMTNRLLLDVLACLAWVLWAAFAIDVAACAVEVARGTRWSELQAGPLRRIAGVLVGTLLIAVVGRAATAAPATTVQSPPFEIPTGGRSAVATAPYRPAGDAAQELVTADVHLRNVEPYPHDIETVRLPEHGVHDSLWRIARRRLGDGNRWPEIWQLNQGIRQSDGTVFTTPSLIRPGWHLTLPTSPQPVLDPPVPPPLPNSTNPEPPHPQRPSAPTADADRGLSLPTGAFVGLGLAALITLAMVSVRLHQRRWYRPGSPRPADPTAAPVVRALRIAHDSASLPRDEDGQLVPPAQPPGARRPAEAAIRDRALATARAVLPDDEETSVGIRDGHTVALDLARGHGLGLVGPGAHAAARALIVTLLAQASAQVVIPAADAHLLFGAEPNRGPTRLRVVDDVAAALDSLETELLARLRDDNTADDGRLVLVATPSAETARRTQAILDNGAGHGLAGLLLGQWRPGETARIHADGTVGATSPTLTDLVGARLFTLPGDDTTDLLTLLRAAEVEHDAPQPRSDLDFEFIESVPAKADAPSSDRKDLPERLSQPDRPPERLQSMLHLQVLGRLRLIHQGRDADDLIGRLAPRQREVLVYLALHRDGCRREALTTALWPDAPGNRPFNAFHATLSQLRRALREATGDATANFVVNQNGHYGLDRTAVTVDLWPLQDALTARRHAATPAECTEAMRRAVELYRGELADSISAEWIEGPREALRRDVLDTMSVLIRAIRDDEPEQALSLLERARDLDPYNEAIYRDLMRTQARLGRHDSVPRTMHLLATSLAELEQRPSRDTLILADNLSETFVSSA
ncbi:LysM peptidoglycan-binding domain-containing protein [Saccharothrix sp. AJ9571]|nr:LysM peptidoglycan-binding domain-containing protein [Saccharothrix sp. AJ9571]